MSPTVDVDDEVFQLLKDSAEPFVDTTPNDVLRRLLGKAAARRNGGTEITRQSAGTTFATAVHAARKTTSAPAPKGRRKARKRAVASELLPEDAYELPILTVLDRAGGWLPTSEAVSQVGRLIDQDLKPKDREKISSGRYRWEMRVQFARHRMVSQGLLKKESPRGVWEISDEGKAKLKVAGSSK